MARVLVLVVDLVVGLRASRQPGALGRAPGEGVGRGGLILSSSHLPACQVEHLSVHSIIHSFVHSFRHALCKPTLRSTWAQPSV